MQAHFAHSLSPCGVARKAKQIYKLEQNDLKSILWYTPHYTHTHTNSHTPTIRLTAQ